MTPQELLRRLGTGTTIYLDDEELAMAQSLERRGLVTVEGDAVRRVATPMPVGDDHRVEQEL